MEPPARISINEIRDYDWLRNGWLRRSCGEWLLSFRELHGMAMAFAPGVLHRGVAKQVWHALCLTGSWPLVAELLFPTRLPRLLTRMGGAVSENCCCYCMRALRVRVPRHCQQSYFDCIVLRSIGRVQTGQSQNRRPYAPALSASCFSFCKKQHDSLSQRGPLVLLLLPQTPLG